MPDAGVIGVCSRHCQVKLLRNGQIPCVEQLESFEVSRVFEFIELDELYSTST